MRCAGLLLVLCGGCEWTAVSTGLETPMTIDATPRVAVEVQRSGFGTVAARARVSSDGGELALGALVPPSNLLVSGRFGALGVAATVYGAQVGWLDKTVTFGPLSPEVAFAYLLPIHTEKEMERRAHRDPITHATTYTESLANIEVTYLIVGLTGGYDWRLGSGRSDAWVGLRVGVGVYWAMCSERIVQVTIPCPRP
jgi:hypothetical protein